MSQSAPARFAPADTITVYVVGPDGAVLDVIEDVDLGDPVEASRNGRTSLKASSAAFLLPSSSSPPPPHARADEARTTRLLLLARRSSPLPLSADAGRPGIRHPGRHSAAERS